MTDLSDFLEDERAQILDAPRAVMEGAIFADGATSAIAFLKELTAGAKVFKEAQRHENRFVKAVAAGIRERKETATTARELPDPDEAIAKAIDQTERAVAILEARAAQADRKAYGAWLVKIATQVAEASRSKKGGFFSRKVAISDAERTFIERITQTVGR